MAAELALNPIQKGDSVPFTFNWTDGVAPIDMRGKTVIMSFKLAAVMADSAATLTKTVVIAVDDADGALGIVSFRLESSETDLLTALVQYHYAIRIIEPASPEDIQTTFLYGTVLVKDA